MTTTNSIPIVYRKKEVAAIFRITSQRLNRLIKDGQIRVIRFGTHEMIPRSEIERILGQDLRYVDLEGLGVRITRKINPLAPRMQILGRKLEGYIEEDSLLIETKV